MSLNVVINGDSFSIQVFGFLVVIHGMDISGISNSTLQQIGNSATQTGDAVSISVMRKALDIQSQQALALIEAAAVVAPRPAAGTPGAKLDVYA